MTLNGNPVFKQLVTGKVEPILRPLCNVRFEQLQERRVFRPIDERPLAERLDQPVSY